MTSVQLDVTHPVIKRDENSSPQVAWDRTPELELGARFLDGEPYDLRLLVLKNLAPDVSLRMARRMAEMANVPLTYLPRPWHARVFPIGLAGHLTNQTGTIAGSLVVEILKYTTAAAVHTLSGSPRLRSVSNYIHSQRRAGAPVRLSEALSRFGIRMLPTLTDEILDADWARAKAPESAYREMFEYDLDQNEFLLRSLQSGCFYINFIVGSSLERFELNVGKTIPCKLIVGDGSGSATEFFAADEQSGRLAIHFGLESLSSATSIVQTEYPTISDSELENILEGAGLRLNYRGQRSSFFSEKELEKALSSAETSISSSLNEQDIEGRRGLVQAEMQGDILRLRGRGIVDSGTPQDVLEALREEHLGDVQRLRTTLAGSNAGQGFLARLEAVERRLVQPLTEANSAVLASQVRALETMFPAVSEMLTDVTSADLAAMLAGLGLFIRQFAGWRQLLIEAQEFSSVDEETISRVITASDIIEKETEFVEEELLQYIDEIKLLATKSADDVVRFGYMRSVGNVLRAVGRYLRARLYGSTKAFNDTVDGTVGTGAAFLVFGSALLAARPQLIQLAASLPDEFGWLIPLLTALGSRIVAG